MLEFLCHLFDPISAKMSREIFNIKFTRMTILKKTCIIYMFFTFGPLGPCGPASPGNTVEFPAILGLGPGGPARPVFPY